MKLSVFAAAAVVAAALPAAPALAHCRTVHHSIHHAAWHAPVRHRAVRYASCGCRARVAYRRAAAPIVYPRRHVVEVAYEHPLTVYTTYPAAYAGPFYGPQPVYGYRGGFEGRRFHRFGYEHRGFEHRHRDWR